MLKRKSARSETTRIFDKTTDTLSNAVVNTERKLESVFQPVRKNVLQRFPILFLMLVALGFTATMTGMEQLLMRVSFLQANPGLLLIIGLALLMLTGTLYKKLG
jgi:hypothetical protein